MMDNKGVSPITAMILLAAFTIFIAIFVAFATDGTRETEFPVQNEMWFDVCVEYENGEPVENAIVYFTDKIPDENKSWIAIAWGSTDNEGKLLTTIPARDYVLAVARKDNLCGWAWVCANSVASTVVLDKNWMW